MLSQLGYFVTRIPLASLAMCMEAAESVMQCQALTRLRVVPCAELVAIAEVWGSSAASPPLEGRRAHLLRSYFGRRSCIMALGRHHCPARNSGTEVALLYYCLGHDWVVSPHFW